MMKLHVDLELKFSIITYLLIENTNLVLVMFLLAVKLFQFVGNPVTFGALMDLKSEDIMQWNEPLIFKNVLDWEIVKWKEKEWRDLLNKSEAEHNFRTGDFSCSFEPRWERKCDTEKMKMSKFVDLFFNSDLKEQWYYFDYKHLFECQEDFKNLDFSWKCVGLDLKAADSTMWMGTEGAHTPCHVDTYSCNFVAQIYGRKTWILISPDENEKMKPTRVPYEESSIYSDINFFCNCCPFPDINEGKVVILEPGDVLYVPNKWWHFVKNDSSAISINTWVPLHSDRVENVKESLVKLFVSNLINKMSKSDTNNILNPNEDDLLRQNDLKLNISELEFCIKKAKKEKKEEFSAHYLKQNTLMSFKGSKIKELRRKCTEKQTKIEDGNELIKKVINAFCHPDVIDLVYDKIKAQD